MDDPELLERLVGEQIPLTICPLSNVKLRAVEDLAGHPLREMLERGLKVTINSDDPAYFGGYINKNYLAAQQALGLNRGQLAALARNSFEASFLGEAEKASRLHQLHDYLDAP